MKTIKYLFAVALFAMLTHVQASTIDANTAINKVLKSYLGIKNALTDDNSKVANEEAKKLTAAIKEANTAQMSVSEKAVWTKYAEKLRFDAEHISASKLIAHQREHFGNLSTNIYAVLKAFHNNEINIYQQYCPMAKKSWISESATIKNPYFGKKMLECGGTKETIKKVIQ